MRVFDGHCDTILQSYLDGRSFLKNGGHLDIERMAGNGHWAQFFAIFWPAEPVPVSEMNREDLNKPLWEVFQAQHEIFVRELEIHADKLVLCRTAREAEKAWKQGKQAAFLSVEGAELLDCDLQKLERAYELGVRAVNLTWNYENALSGSNDQSPKKGLTAQGRAFVEKMQELGMLVDVSHLSDPGFWDVMETAKKPIFASHSNARAVCSHPRNLTDEQFTAIIEKHGVAGLNMCDQFLGPDPDLDTVVAHIEHWLSLGGEKNISLGGDWDGITHPPRGVSGIQDLDKLVERLLARNYSEDLIEDLLCNNLMRVVSEVCTM